MAKGKRLAIAQLASLMWAQDVDLDAYIETGRGGEQTEVIPYNPELRSEIVKNWEAAQ